MSSSSPKIGYRTTVRRPKAEFGARYPKRKRAGARAVSEPPRTRIMAFPGTVDDVDLKGGVVSYIVGLRINDTV